MSRPHEANMEEIEPEALAREEGITKLEPHHRQKGIWYYKMLAKREELRVKRTKAPSIKLPANERELIRSFVADQLANGEAIRGIVKRTMEEFNISSYNAKKIVDEAKETLKELTDTDIIYQRTAAIRRMENWMEEAIKRGQLKTALAIQKQLIELLGLAEPKKIDASLQVYKPIEQMSQQELEILLGDDKNLLNEGKE